MQRPTSNLPVIEGPDLRDDGRVVAGQLNFPTELPITEIQLEREAGLFVLSEGESSKDVRLTENIGEVVQVHGAASRLALHYSFNLLSLPGLLLRLTRLVITFISPSLASLCHLLHLVRTFKNRAFFAADISPAAPALRAVLQASFEELHLLISHS
jgi:hypothetical protein